jgi:hypothetical protein
MRLDLVLNVHHVSFDAAVWFILMSNQEAYFKYATTTALPALYLRRVIWQSADISRVTAEHR